MALLSSYGGEEWMTQVEDEKRQARLTGGLLTTHRQMKERQNNCSLFSCLQEEEEVAVRGWWRKGGVFPGFQIDAIPVTPHVQTRTQKNA